MFVPGKPLQLSSEGTNLKVLHSEGFGCIVKKYNSLKRLPKDKHYSLFFFFVNKGKSFMTLLKGANVVEKILCPCYLGKFNSELF